jgi:CubicO group peptidase (beta-lactamase class C family)
MAIASASTWIYGAYVVQRQGGALSDADRKFLQMRSGYVGLDNCGPSQTVDSCLASGTNGAYSAGADGRFDDGGGHLQKHASLSGLGGMDKLALAAEIQSQIGSDVALSYARPQPAGGLRMTPDAYALFLRKLLDGRLLMGAVLGHDAVCTDAQTCGGQQALYSPTPASDGWHYALAHWVEDDPSSGDGAFSGGGAFGFYPWIDATKTNYGIVARAEQDGGRASALCGRLIRKAWATGELQ